MAHENNTGSTFRGGVERKSLVETVEACTAAYDLALSYIEGAYGYPDQVLFDPTLTTEPYRFRPTLAGALSYFLGTKCLNLVGKIQFPDGNTDGTAFFEYGFGLRNKGTDQEGWCSVDWDSQEFLYNIDDDEFCETVVALGQMCFINCADNSPWEAIVPPLSQYAAETAGTPSAKLWIRASTSDCTRQCFSPFLATAPNSVGQILEGSIVWHTKLVDGDSNPIDKEE